jgi:hypothetical protein
MEGFKKLSEVDLSIVETKCDNEITLFPRLYKAEFVVDIGEQEEPNRYLEGANRQNRQLKK